MAVEGSWPLLEACFSWQRKYWEKYEGAVNVLVTSRSGKGEEVTHHQMISMLRIA